MGKSWVDKLSPAERLRMAKEKTDNLIDVASHLAGIHAQIEAIRMAPIVGSQWAGGDGANEALRITMDAIYDHFVTRIGTLWDTSTKDRVSLPTVLNLIEDSRVKELIEREAGDSLEPARASRNTDRTRDHYVQFCKTVTRKEEWYGEALKHIRNGRLAHNLSGEYKDSHGHVSVKRGEIEDLFRTSIECIELADLSLRQSCFDWDSARESRREEASAFWGKLSHPSARMLELAT